MDNFISLIYQIIVIFIITTGSWLGLWIYSVDKKNKLNQATCWFFISLVLWSSLDVITNFPLFYRYALYIGRLEWAIISIFFMSAYFFAVYFPKEGKRHYLLEKTVIIIEGIFSVISLFTGWVIKEININPSGSIYVFDRAGYIDAIIMIPLTVIIIFTVFNKYFSLSAEEKLKVQYFLLGLSIFAVSNLIINVGGILFGYLSPLLTIVAYFSTVFFIGFTAYAILKKGLFGIKIILTQLLVGVMGIVLLILPFIMGAFWQKVILFAIFFLFCIVGYLLIKYVRREINQKEVLEDKVKERTAELEKSKNVAEDRAKEIEKWYHLTVGREIRMAELKDEMKKIKEKKEGDKQ